MKFNELISSLTDADNALRSEAVKAVNLALVVRNWLFGWYIVEFEQNGEDRAKYGKKLIEQIARSLKNQGVLGCAVTNLRNFRVFYDRFVEKGDIHDFQIHQTLSGEFRILLPNTINSTECGAKPSPLKSQTLSDEFGKQYHNSKKTAVFSIF
ncbi:MAG: DUF1016 N-terminal domain-containing protein [Planctomycetia bacterium]|nr:DUF1016 N-terminal domain-containing protein [Planctomycetia bacterium]